MLPEISLNILDIAQNSIRAKASRITIRLKLDSRSRRLFVEILDDGRGMTREELMRVSDPFYTSRTTRRVGLGIPFFKQEAECTGGSFSITSAPSEGTRVRAVFCTDHIDCMPLGDINGTIYLLVTMHEEIDFLYEYAVDDAHFSLDTAQMREILGDVSFAEPEVASFLREYLRENTAEVNQSIRE